MRTRTLSAVARTPLAAFIAVSAVSAFAAGAAVTSASCVRPQDEIVQVETPAAETASSATPFAPLVSATARLPALSPFATPSADAGATADGDASTKATKTDADASAKGTKTDAGASGR